jgi:hypothetical protein
MAKDIRRLGWFWEMIHMILTMKPTTTITEVQGQGDFWGCTMDDCHLPFQSEKALRPHFTQAHTDYAVEGWETKSKGEPMQERQEAKARNRERRRTRMKENRDERRRQDVL